MDREPSGHWPLCGRDGDLSVIADWFANGSVGGVILQGDAGVGKSAVAAAIPAVVAADRVVEIDRLGDVDRDAILHAIDDHDGRTLVIVDDMSDLDVESLDLIVQLVASGSAFIVTTLRADATAPSALIDLERSGGVRRLLIEPLTHDAIANLLSRVLDGPIAAICVLQLVEASGGNPLYLRELVEQATADRLLEIDRTGQWTLTAAIVPGGRLVDVISERVGQLSDDVLELAKMLALGGPLRWSRLERGGYADAGLALEHTSFARVHAGVDPVIEITHPLHGDVIRSAIKVLERRRLLTQLIGCLDFPDATVNERLRVADWQLSVGLHPELSTLEEGARRAWSARDHAAAERFAAAALDQQPTLAMATIRVEALVHMGAFDDADAIAERCLIDDDGSAPRDRSRLVGLRVFNNLWYRERPDEAAAAVHAERRSNLDPIGADELLIQEAYVASAQAGAHAVLDLIEDHDWTQAVAPQGLLLTAQMMASTGRAIDGMAAIRRAAVVSADHGVLVVSSPGSIDAATVRVMILAGDLDGAGDLIAELRERPEYRTDPFMRGQLLLSAGRLALHRGQPVTATQLFAEGRSVGEQHANRVTTMGCTAGLAIAAAQLHDGAACRTLYVELESFEMARAVRPSIAAGMAWTLHELGAPARARELLAAEAESALGRGEVIDAAMLACDLARLGDTVGARPILAELVLRVDGIARLLCDAGLALAGSSVDDLLDVEARAAATGMSLLAAELAAAGGRAYRRRADGRAAAAGQVRSAEHLARCEGASTPATILTDSILPLTNRERDIAALAAAGLSNQEIAERLSVSVRTVGNHLQNTYAKLGVNGRADLADVIAPGR